MIVLIIEIHISIKMCAVHILIRKSALKSLTKSYNTKDNGSVDRSKCYLNTLTLLVYVNLLHLNTIAMNILNT